MKRSETTERSENVQAQIHLQHLLITPSSLLFHTVTFQYDHVFPVTQKASWTKGFKLSTSAVLSGTNATVLLAGAESGTRAILEGGAKSDYDGVLSKVCGEIVEHLGEYGPGEPKTYKNR